MADERLEIEITLDDGSIKKGFANIKKSAEDAGEESGAKFRTGFGKFVGGVALGSIIGNAISSAARSALNSVEGLIKDAIKEASQAEIAMGRFTQALASQGKTRAEIEATSASFKNFAESLKSVFQDDQILSGGARLALVGKLSGDALNKASQAAVDLASGLGVDVESAFNLVAKAAGGNTEALGRYGIKIDESIPKSERFAAALAQIQAQFGGQAEAKLNTFDGAIASLNNSFSNFLETIGNAIVKSPAVIALLRGIGDAFNTLNSFLKGLGKENFLDDLIKSAVNFSTKFISFVLPPIEILFNQLRLRFAVMETLFFGLVNVASKAGKLIAGAIGEPIIFIIETTAKAIALFDKELADKLFDAAGRIKEGVTSVFSSAEEESANSFDKAKQKATDLFNAISETPIADAIVKQVNAINTGVQSAEESLPRLTKSVVTNGAILNQELEKLAGQISKVLQQGILNTISGTIQRIGASLVQGGKAFDDFGKFILGLLGDLAIQIGTMMIGLGIGIEQLKVSLASFSGAGLIAAGVALIAIGGALKAISGTSSGLGGAVGGGVAGGTGAAPVGEPVELGTPQSLGAQTAVNVNIEGNVLDRRETGLEIANVLNEFFENQNGVVARA